MVKILCIPVYFTKIDLVNLQSCIVFGLNLRHYSKNVTKTRCRGNANPSVFTLLFGVQFIFKIILTPNNHCFWNAKNLHGPQCYVFKTISDVLDNIQIEHSVHMTETFSRKLRHVDKNTILVWLANISLNLEPLLLFKFARKRCACNAYFIQQFLYLVRNFPKYYTAQFENRSLFETLPFVKCSI